jgi:hypothetical protein
MRYWFILAGFMASGVALIVRGTSSPGDDFVGSWEKVKVVCDRDRGRDLSHAYDTDRADTVSVLHFKSADRGVLEEIHLGGRSSCSGRSDFSVQFLSENQLKLLRGPVYWEAKSARDLRKLGCTGEDKKQVTLLGYAYDPENDTLKLMHKDHSRVCKQLVSVYRRI